MKKVVSTFLACLSLSLSGYLPLAQAENSEPVNMPLEEWRKKPPQASAPRPFKLPVIIKYQLDNGLSVELVEDHRVPFTTAGLGINAGAVDDARQYQGVAALVADLLSQGAAGKSSKVIAEEIDFIGGALSGGAGSDFTIVSASALSQYNAKLIDLFGKVVLTPDFPQSELNLRKTNLIQELKIRRSKPDFLREEKFAGVVFGAHPYSYVAPKPDVIEKITREQLQAFHKEHYVPSGSVLVVVGDFKAEEMKALIAKTFTGWKQAIAPKNEFAAAAKQSGRKIYLVDRPGSVQSSVRIGNLGIKRNDPDFYAMNVANQVLGGAAVSRLFTNIRENKGYTYGAYSEMSARKEPGALSAAAEVRTEVTAAAVQEFLYELERIRNVKPTDKELDAAKNYLAGSFQLGLETQNGLAQRLLEGKLYGLPDNYLESYGEKIMAVKADDVRRVARGHIDQDNLVVVVVGDAGKIKADLEYFAPVSVFDTAGALVKSEEKAKKTGS